MTSTKKTICALAALSALLAAAPTLANEVAHDRLAAAQSQAPDADSKLRPAAKGDATSKSDTHAQSASAKQEGCSGCKCKLDRPSAPSTEDDSPFSPSW